MSTEFFKIISSIFICVIDKAEDKQKEMRLIQCNGDPGGKITERK